MLLKFKFNYLNFKCYNRMPTKLVLLCVSFIWMSFGLLNFANASKKYDGSVVLEITADNDRAKLIQLVDEFNLDVWKEGIVPESAWHVMVAEHEIKIVTNKLEQCGITWTVHIEDVQSKIQIETEQIQKRRLLQGTGQMVYDYNSFNEYSEFQTELASLAADCPEDFNCEIYSAGQTYEGNDLNVLHIWKAGANRRAYWLEAMMHAREWLAGTTHMNIVQRLLREYGVDPDATQLMDEYDWYLLPVVNVDGYIYTWTDDRLWRKNRSPNEGSDCIGTDLNRNYEYRWGEVGSSTNPCSGTYRGPGPASEPVTINLQSEMSRLNGSLDAWITLHSYSQFWLTSWAYTVNSPGPGGECALPDDYDDLLRVATAAANAAESSSGDVWQAGSWCQVLYESSGTTQDHAKAAGIKYTFTPELRGDSFVVDESEIPISFEEVWEALVATVNEIEAIKR